MQKYLKQEWEYIYSIAKLILNLHQYEKIHINVKYLGLVVVFLI